MRLHKTRKGMSELLAIVIGVVITVGIAAILWTVLPSIVSNAVNTARVAVTASAISISTDEALVTVHIKVLGSSQVDLYGLDVVTENSSAKIVEVSTISNVTADVVGSSIKFVNGLKLNPGDEISVTFRIDGVSAGEKIAIIVKTSVGSITTSTRVST